MANWTVREERLPTFLSQGEFGERFIPVAGKHGAGFARAGGIPDKPPALRQARGPASVKPFCFPPTERVAQYSEGPVTAPAVATRAQTLLVGARACELQAMAYLDRVFGDSPVSDPFYQEHRREQMVIAVDCVEAHETCFCNMVGGRPYATTGFDINLTPIQGKYLIEVGSEAGQAFIEQAREVLEDATEADLAERDSIRNDMVDRLQEANASYSPSRPPEEALAKKEDSDIWDRLASGCVECGACTQICPTCHCFFMFDQTRQEGLYERIRAWDSCVWSGYSRMAGAAGMKPNPRSRFRSRFANRFLHKYLWSLQQWDMLGCVGCGRCVEGCPGQIDIREVIREVSA